MPAQPLQHIIHQQHQQNKQQPQQQQYQQNKQQQQQQQQPQQQQQQPTSATSQKKGQDDTGALKGQWPPKLKAYVERVFEKCTEDAERVEMEGELKKVITRSISENTLWTNDWDREPLIA
jgi:hypothetical protein